MDSSAGISPASLDQYSKNTGDAVTMKTMKMAMDVQANAAAQLIESVPSPAQSGNKGVHVDVKV
ncbi:MAG: putative motility protein [Gammaproteobacteria bacterium]|nr:putative motility protein [Gammaproteobacteria bacterium]